MNTNQQLNFFLKNEGATQELGASLAFVFSEFLKENDSLLVTLSGQLGTGKTTLVRACLRALGINGAIKSPTYTLLEPYENKLSIEKEGANKHELKRLKIAHLDLYRLLEPEELDYIGGRNLNTDYNLILIEWPDKGEGYIPEPSLKIQLNHRDKGREAQLISFSDSLFSKLKHIENN